MSTPIKTNKYLNKLIKLMKHKNKKKISISIPVFNEQDNIILLHSRISQVADDLKDDFEFEFLFTDNRSQDNTWELISEIAKKDKRVKALKFSKNVGFQKSILMNYMHTTGDAVVQLDADMQDPPEMIKTFIKFWMKGNKVVFGVRRNRPESIIMRSFRFLGYWVINKLSKDEIHINVGDFRLLDRQVVDALVKLKTSSPYLRGMVAELGFDQFGIEYDRFPRKSGKTKFNFYMLFQMGLGAIFNHSTIPLRISSLLGLIIILLSMLGALYYFYLKFYSPFLPIGVASIHILVLFGIGVNAFLLGIISEYIQRIFLILRNEPIAIIEKVINIKL